MRTWLQQSCALMTVIAGVAILHAAEPKTLIDLDNPKVCAGETYRSRGDTMRAQGHRGIRNCATMPSRCSSSIRSARRSSCSYSFPVFPTGGMVFIAIAHHPRSLENLVRQLYSRCCRASSAEALRRNVAAGIPARPSLSNFGKARRVNFETVRRADPSSRRRSSPAASNDLAQESLQGGNQVSWRIREHRNQMAFRTSVFALVLGVSGGSR